MLIRADFDGNGSLDVAYLARKGELRKWKAQDGTVYNRGHMLLIVELGQKNGGKKVIVFGSSDSDTVFSGFYLSLSPAGRRLAVPKEEMGEIPIYHRYPAIELGQCGADAAMYYWSSKRKQFLFAQLYH